MSILKSVLVAVLSFLLVTNPSYCLTVKGELKEALLQKLAADPSPAYEGMIYYNTVSKAAMFYDGVAWNTMGGSAAVVPPGTLVPFSGGTVPGGWLLAYGQLVSRTTYAALFAAIGSTYGNGDGSTTFGLPDMRGRVPGGKDDMGGTAANRITVGGSNIDATIIGNFGGSQFHIMTLAEMVSHAHGIDHDHPADSTGTQSVNHSHTINHAHGNTGTSTASLSAGGNALRLYPVGSSGVNALVSNGTGAAGQADSHAHTTPTYNGSTGSESANHSHTFNVPPFSGSSGDTGSSAAFQIMQPTIIFNYIIKY